RISCRISWLFLSSLIFISSNHLSVGGPRRHHWEYLVIYIYGYVDQAGTTALQRLTQHAGMVVVCDGSEDADRRLMNVLTNDPGTGVMRHADAGYQEAIDCANEQGMNLPMLEQG
ncbi:MAG: hypothetical protein HN577_01360, partial [Rhodospirillaceae bacterium]|nr:hypothetical protein [Rhodospirillaceae bacterium]